MTALAVLVFIDESGKPGLNEDDPYVLAALLIEEKSFTNFEGNINELMERHLSIYDLATAELHAKDLVQRKDVYRAVPATVRSRLFRDILEITASYAEQGHLEAIIVSVWKDLRTCVDKEKLKYCIAEEAFGKLIERVAWALIDFDESSRGILIIDQSELDDHIRNIIEKELLKGQYTPTIPSSKRLMPDPIFARSYHYRSLQVADLIAYTYRRYARIKRGLATITNTDKIFNITKAAEHIIKNRILRKRSDGGVEGYGLKEWYVFGYGC